MILHEFFHQIYHIVNNLNFYDRLLREEVLILFAKDDHETEQFCEESIEQILENRTKKFENDIFSGDNSSMVKSLFETNSIDPTELEKENFWDVFFGLNSNSPKFKKPSFSFKKSKNDETQFILNNAEVDIILSDLIDRGFRDQVFGLAFLEIILRFHHPKKHTIIDFLLAEPHEIIDELPDSLNTLLYYKGKLIVQSVNFFFKLNAILRFLQGDFKGWPDVNVTDRKTLYDCFYHLETSGWTSFEKYSFKKHSLKVDSKQMKDLLSEFIQWAKEQNNDFPFSVPKVEIEETKKWISRNKEE